MKIALLLTLALAGCASTPSAKETGMGTSDSTHDELAGPMAVVTELYDRVTFGPGEAPDWGAVRALFVDDALIVLRTSRDATTAFSLDGFVADFVAFAARPDVVARGFAERILDTTGYAYGDAAHVLVRFDSEIPGSGRPPGEGIDGISLVRSDGRWRIVSIVNERPPRGEPVPAALFAR